MKLNEFGKILPVLWETNTSLLLLGPPGVGKTEYIKNELPGIICASTGGETSRFHVVVESAADKAPPDFGGHMAPSKDDKGRFTIALSVPPVLNRVMALIANDPECGGVLFLDEVLQGADVQKTLSPYYDGTIADRYLNKRWRIIGAGNLAANKAGTSRSLTHNSNRHWVGSIEPDVPGWISWAQREGIHSHITSYVDRHQHAITAGPPPQVLQSPDPEAYCTARSITKLNAFLAIACKQSGQTLNELLSNPETPYYSILHEAAVGFIGREHATELFGFIRRGLAVPKFSAVVADPDAVAMQMVNEDLATDIWYMTTHMLHNQLSKRALAAKQALSGNGATPELINAMSQVLVFINYVPDQFKLTAATRLCNDDNTCELLGKCPTWTEWVSAQPTWFNHLIAYTTA